ncbi:hypothetical protein RJT34_25285 [Clitoria ternatea]|uniref:Gnk2-homologous domain-containing protein n=1 Tax=Clitoria ternatea TaxID=43366 RepID=A0AAN9IGQ1_CLITE
MGVLSLRSLAFRCCLLLITTFITQATAENNAQNYHYFCDYNHRGNYTGNSTYSTNLNTLLSTLTSNKEIDYGFYNFTYGQNGDKVNAIGLCRGDVKPDECRACLNGSRANLTQLCPNRKEAIGWYEDEKCMLRYSDRSIFGLNEIGPAYFAWSVNNATQVEQFNKMVKSLLDELKGKAASGNSRYKYATGNMSGPDNQHVYGLVQCTPDLSESDCDKCLVQSITKDIPNCCSNRIGARIVRPSCNLRFEASSFYGPPAYAYASSPLPSSSLSPLPSPAASTASNNTEDKGNTSGTEVAIVPLLLLLLCSFLFVSV